jgi:hypothetical protein
VSDHIDDAEGCVLRLLALALVLFVIGMLAR